MEHHRKKRLLNIIRKCIIACHRKRISLNITGLLNIMVKGIIERHGEKGVITCQWEWVLLNVIEKGITMKHDMI